MQGDQKMWRDCAVSENFITISHLEHGSIRHNVRNDACIRIPSKRITEAKGVKKLEEETCKL